MKCKIHKNLNQNQLLLDTKIQASADSWDLFHDKSRESNQNHLWDFDKCRNISARGFGLYADFFVVVGAGLVNDIIPTDGFRFLVSENTRLVARPIHERFAVEASL